MVRQGNAFKVHFKYKLGKFRQRWEHSEWRLTEAFDWLKRLPLLLLVEQRLGILAEFWSSQYLVVPTVSGNAHEWLNSNWFLCGNAFLHLYFIFSSFSFLFVSFLLSFFFVLSIGDSNLKWKNKMVRKCQLCFIRKGFSMAEQTIIFNNMTK